MASTPGGSLSITPNITASTLIDAHFHDESVRPSAALLQRLTWFTSEFAPRGPFTSSIALNLGLDLARIQNT